MMPLDRKSSVMKHVTVTRVFLVVVLGCAAASVHWAFRMRNECATLCPYISPRLETDGSSIILNTSSPSVSSSTPNLKLSVAERDYHRTESHSVIRTTATATTVQTHLKTTTVQVPSTFRRHSSPAFHLPAPVDGKCTTPLFCSSRLVRNCITNEIIGQVPATVRSQRMKPPKSRSVETSHMRRQSFKKVFDTRAWGHSWDFQHRGLNASGEWQLLALLTTCVQPCLMSGICLNYLVT